MNLYILSSNHDIIRCYDEKIWLKWFEYSNKTICTTTDKGITVSTVFLGIDHNFSKGLPILFETMIFRDDDEYELIQRHSTYEEAKIGHENICKIFISQVLCQEPKTNKRLNRKIDMKNKDEYDT